MTTEIKDMTTIMAECNEVVAAQCCAHCIHALKLDMGGNVRRTVCMKLKCFTFDTDRCKHFSQDHE